MRILLLISSLILYLAEKVKVQPLEVFLWPNDWLQRMDPYLDLGFPAINSTTKNILPSGSQYESTDVLTNSETIIYNLTNMTSLMRTFITNNTQIIGFMYQRNNSFAVDDRVFGEYRYDTNLMQKQFLADLSTDTNFTKVNTTCFDARVLNTTVTRNNTIAVVCKEFDSFQGTAQVKIVLITINGTNVTSVTYANSSKYITNTRVFLTISWTSYVRTTVSCDNIEDIVVITDNRIPTVTPGTSPNVAVFNGAPSLVMFIAGHGQIPGQSRIFGLSDPINVKYIDAGTSSVIAGTVFTQFVTNAYSVSTASGQKSCKNIFYMMSRVNSNKFNCFLDPSNLDENIVNLMLQMIPPANTEMTVRCLSVETVVTSTYAMEKAFRVDNVHEVYFRARAIYQTVPGTRKIAYEAAVMKPSEVVVTTLTTHFRTIEVNSTKLPPQPTSPGLFEHANVIIVVPEKLLYVCWSVYKRDNTLTNVKAYTDFRNNSCYMVDVFTVSKEFFNPLEISSAISCFTFVRRMYGPFISLNFDFSSGTFQPVRMLAMKRYVDPKQVPFSEYMLALYDLSRNLNAFRLSSTSTSIPATLAIPDLRDPGDLVTNTIMNIGTSFISMRPNLTTFTIGFKNQSLVNIGALDDRIYTQSDLYTITSFDSTVHSPYLIVATKNPLQYLPSNTPPENTVIVDDKLVKFTIINGTYTVSVHLAITNLSKGANSDGQFKLQSQQAIQLGGLFQSSKNNYDYSNFLRAEIAGNGLYMYFANTTANNNYCVLRFGLTRYLFTSRESTLPLRVFETISRLFIISLNLQVNPQRIFWARVPETVDKNVGWVEPRGWNWNFTIDGNYSLNGIDDLSLMMDRWSKSVFLNMFVHSSQLWDPKVLILQYTWDDQSEYDKIGPIVKIRRTIDISGFLNDTTYLPILKQRCVFSDGVALLNTSSSTDIYLTLTVLNTTTMSLTWYTEKTVAGGGSSSLQCGNSHFLAIFQTTTATYKTVFYRFDAGLAAYKRIRRVDIYPTAPLPIFAFSPSTFTIIHNANNFTRLWKYSTRVYLSAGTKVSYPALPTTVKTPNIVLPFSLYNQSTTTLTVSTIELTKPSMIYFPQIYIGSETIELQKKIRYEDDKRTTYALEETYRLPMSFFDLQLRGNIPANRISILERVRKYGQIDLWQEAMEFNQKRCKFGLRGSNMTGLIDDIMLRVDTEDNSFCMQLSKLSTNDNKMSMVKVSDFQQSNGYVKGCKIIRDMSLFTVADISTKKSQGAQISYAVACIMISYGYQSLWIIYVPVGDNFDNIFKVSNLVTWPVQFMITSFEAILIDNNLFIACYNDQSFTLWYQKSVYTFGSGVTTSPGFTAIENVFSFDTIYTNPTEAGRKTTGILLLVSVEDQLNKSLHYIDKYRVQSSGDVSLLTSERYNMTQPISDLNCAYQQEPGVTPFLNCVYLPAFSRSTIYYTVDILKTALITPPKEDYVAPLHDLEVKQIKIFYLRRFWYLTLSYSPLTGRTFILIYKHVTNTTEKILPVQNASTLASSDLIIHDSVELTNSNINPETAEISMFNVGGTDYMAIHEGSILSVYRFNHLEISIDGSIPFADIANTKILIVDHLMNPHIELPLSLFFREKVAVSYVWLLVLLGGIGLGIVLITIYLIFKKKKGHIESEIESKMFDSQRKPKEKNSKSKDDCKDKQSEETRKKSVEVELL